ncbi:unnamed protein product [Schistocephalus solidus]|uniref:Omp85 domain-containing protein n=1 Tax=Schistocephalus solidus TaxID=70667 RepID=A0A183TLD6_SCHSO|nr:unnamed protein product [Schistocephalus solidus]
MVGYDSHALGDSAHTSSLEWSAGGGGVGYTFLSGGRSKAESRDAGVAFDIRNDIVGRLPYPPQGINDRLICLRLPLRGIMFAKIISAYALPLHDELWCGVGQILRGPECPAGG